MSFKPFRILYLSSFAELFGGGQLSLFHLVKNIDKSMFHPHVILPSKGALGEKLMDYNIPVSFLELPKIAIKNVPRILIGIAKLYKLTQDYKIDIIHTDGPRNTFYAGLIAKLKRIPLVWHIRASNKDRYDRLLIHLCTRLILVANSLRSRFDWDNLGQKLVTIYNGIDLSEFDGQDRVTNIRDEYGISEQSLVIGDIGRIEYSKGQKYLIEACGKLKGELPPFHLLFIGEIADPTYKEKCEKTARKFGISDRAIFAGYRDKLIPMLKDIEIVVFPSILFDAFPRSIIEAMGARKPVITTNVGGCSEAVEDFVSGFIVPKGDSNAMADKILILARDKHLRSKIGTAARTRAEKMFTIEKNVRETEKLYKDILGIH